MPFSSLAKRPDFEALLAILGPRQEVWRSQRLRFRQPDCDQLQRSNPCHRQLRHQGASRSKSFSYRSPYSQDGEGLPNQEGQHD